MNQSIPEGTGAKIHYHIDVFTPKNISTLACVASVAIVLLVLGILSLSLISGKPPIASYALIGLGGGVLLGDVVVLGILAYKHRQAKKLKEAFMEHQAKVNSGSWEEMKGSLEK